MSVFRVETKPGGIVHLVLDDPARTLNVLDEGVSYKTRLEGALARAKTPARRAPTREPMAARNVPCPTRRWETSSVRNDSCGSITRNIRMVANPLMIAERLLQVTR